MLGSCLAQLIESDEAQLILANSKYKHSLPSIRLISSEAGAEIKTESLAHVPMVGIPADRKVITVPQLTSWGDFFVGFVFTELIDLVGVGLASLEFTLLRTLLKRTLCLFASQYRLASPLWFVFVHQRSVCSPSSEGIAVS